MALGQEAVLQPGSTGALVRALQEKLDIAGFHPGPLDGIYGPQTTTAVRAFQKARGLTVDGVAGPEVWAALAPKPGPRAGLAPVPIPSPARFDWLPDAPTVSMLLTAGILLLMLARRR